MDSFPPNVETETFQKTDKLRLLRIEHRNLDEQIENLQQELRPNELELRRLKKQKLLLKDLIARAESDLIPDLDA